MKRLKILLLILPYVTAGFFLIYMREKAVPAAAEGLRLCACAIVPSVLPFAVLAKYFYLSGDADIVAQQLGGKVAKLLNLSEISTSVFLLGYVSGYPVCAELSVGLFKENKISKEEVQRLISFSNNPSPSFVIGFIGGSVLGSLTLGTVMYACIGMSSFLYAYFSGVGAEKCRSAFCKSKTSGRIPSFNAAVVSSVGAMPVICGFTVVFSVISAGLKELVKNGCVRNAVLLLLEITVGMVNVKNDIALSPLSFAALSSFASFSGLCVLSQIAACLNTAKLESKTYIKGKLIQSATTFVLSFLTFSIFFD